MQYPDADQTLPSVATPLSESRSGHALLLTILFHPQTSRIGETVRVPGTSAREPWVLGRLCPEFQRAGDDKSAPLNDPHLSRCALEFEYGGSTLRLRRPEGSSRCRLGGSELADVAELDTRQLEQGIPLLLSHSVVLMLRLGSMSATTTPVAGPLLGCSPALGRLREEVLRAADSNLDVLVRGETGSGKEVVAAAIHAAGDSADRPWVSVNMAAIPPELAPAALFGSVKGAYTGAEHSSAGYFRQAHGGTLFLDEIGDTPGPVQAQLLRALQQREIQPVGGEVETVELRVISATDAQLDTDSGFKSALRHRLGALEINVPPLREHPEDVGQLLMHFLSQRAAATHCAPLAPQDGMDAPVVAAWAYIFFLFSLHHWPGNVRELGNFAAQLSVADDGKPVLSEHALSVLSASPVSKSSTTRRPAQRRMSDISDEEFGRAMEEHAFEIKSVARHLRVSRTSVYRRIERSERFQLLADLPPQDVEQAFAAADRDVGAAARALRVSASSLRAHVRKLGLG